MPRKNVRASCGLPSANLAFFFFDKVASLCDSLSCDCEVVTLTWGLVWIVAIRVREQWAVLFWPSAYWKLAWIHQEPSLLKKKTQRPSSGSSPLVRRHPNASLRPVVPGRRVYSPSPAMRVRREEEPQRVDPGAAAYIPREKGEGAGKIYFFQLLHLSQLGGQREPAAPAPPWRSRPPLWERFCPKAKRYLSA